MTDTTKKPTIGDLIFRTRARLDMSQKEFVAFLGLRLERVSISKYECNEMKPSRRRLMIIKEKIAPHLREDELAILNEMSW